MYPILNLRMSITHVENCTTAEIFIFNASAYSIYKLILLLNGISSLLMPLLIGHSIQRNCGLY